MRALTLRSRTTLTAVVIVALVLGAGAWVLLTTLDRQLVAMSDRASIVAVGDLVDQAGGERLPSVLTLVDDDGVAQVFAADGTVLAASANITGRGPITSAADSTVVRQRTFDGPDDEETETYRSWVVSAPTSAGDVTVVVGNSLESAHEASRRLRTLLLLGVPLAVLLLGAVVWLLVGRALGRLDRIRARVDAIEPDQLGLRFAEHGPHDEVGRLAATMNRMLARVDAAVTRQRQLVADVSHDLQGPLAAQRLALEVALRDPAAIDADQLRSGVLGPTRAMERLVDDLLVLAAADEHAPVATSLVDLDAVVLDEAARARAHTRVRIDTARVSAGPVRVSSSEVRRAVRNLIDNAVSYAASVVELSVVTTDEGVFLDVVDDGPGIAPEGAGARLRAVPSQRPVTEQRCARQRPRARHRPHGGRARGRTARPHRGSRRCPLPDGAAGAPGRGHLAEGVEVGARGADRGHHVVDLRPRSGQRGGTSLLRITPTRWSTISTGGFPPESAPA